MDKGRDLAAALHFLNKFDYTVCPECARLFYPEVRKYYPNLKDGSLEPGYSGIRPKLSGPGQAPVDFVIQSVEPQIIDDDEEEDVVKEVVILAPEEAVSAAAESFVIPVPPVVVDSEMTNDVDSSFSQVSNQKEEFSSVVEAQKSEQIENPAKVVPLDDEEKPSEAPRVSNGVANGVKPLETDNQGAAVVINSSREVDNCTELEIQKKPTEDQVDELYKNLDGDAMCYSEIEEYMLKPYNWNKGNIRFRNQMEPTAVCFSMEIRKVEYEIASCKGCYRQVQHVV